MFSARQFTRCTALLITAVVLGAFSIPEASAMCTVPRIAAEFEIIKVQRAKCEDNDELPFCEKAEDYQPLMTNDEANAAWDCLAKKALGDGFASTPFPANVGYKEWKNYSKAPYQSAHINRFVDDISAQAIFVANFANEKGKAYSKYDKAGKMPEGAILAKYSMVISGQGGVVDLAPVYLMTKLKKRSSKKTGDWKYDLIAPKGLKLLGRDVDMEFTQELCAGCHMNYGIKSDSMLFMPEDVRVKN